MYDFSNFNLKPSNVMSCQEMNKQKEAGDDESEEYEEENVVTAYVVEKFWLFEN